jgi:hypothetical protein
MSGGGVRDEEPPEASSHRTPTPRLTLSPSRPTPLAWLAGPVVAATSTPAVLRHGSGWLAGSYCSGLAGVYRFCRSLSLIPPHCMTG